VLEQVVDDRQSPDMGTGLDRALGGGGDCGGERGVGLDPFLDCSEIEVRNPDHALDRDHRER
jgi:hypothetical protein